MSQPATPHEEIPRWKVLVAVGALAVVGVVTVATVVWRGPDRTPAAGASATGGGNPTDVSAATPSPGGDAPDPGPSAAEERAALVAGIRAALDAWEAFARSAEMDYVEEAFVTGGPQYRQFRREARRGHAGPAVQRVPDMSLRSVLTVDGDGQRRSVLARVALTGADGQPDVREWVFVLHRAPGGAWRVWTVVDRTPEA
jgi:hypothetical protein